MDGVGWGWVFKIEKRCLMWRGYRKLGNYYMYLYYCIIHMLERLA